MGTRMTMYVVAGIRFGDPDDLGDSGQYDDIHENDYKSSFDKDKIAMVWDGMNGDYAVVGKVLAKGLEEDGGYGMTRANLPARKLRELLEEIRQKHPGIHAKYEELKGDKKKARLGVWAFSHWH